MSASGNTARAPAKARLGDALGQLYGAERAEALVRELLPAAEGVRVRPSLGHARPAVIAVYPDHVLDGGMAPLAALRRFLEEEVGGVGPALLHVLPPYVSDGDDGFAVVDHRAVHPRLGTWEDLERLSDVSGGLMLDLVMNHVSTSHPAFRDVLRGEGRPGDFHLFSEPRAIEWGTRVRTSSILQRFGEHWAWCTYGRAQVDLNHGSPDVFLSMAGTLLRLVEAGARVVRLDAIPHVWKRIPGGPHQPEAKLLVRALRAVADLVDPSVRLLAETDHRTGERCYLGEELAQHDNHLAVPLLVFAAALAGEGGPLVDWVNASAADERSRDGYAFLQTHDGVHLRPMDPPLDAPTLRRVMERMERAGVRVSYADVGGEPQPYELNSSLHRIFSTEAGLDVERYLAAHALLFALPATPCLYFPTLFGLPDAVGVEPSNPRAANRHRYSDGALRAQVRQPVHARILKSLLGLIRLRDRTPALREASGCEARMPAPWVLHLARSHARQPLHVLVNFGVEPVSVPAPSRKWTDLLGGRQGQGDVLLAPSEALWLVEAGSGDLT
ncbi:alpha-amylase family glycosyl hydrolase [Corallococcus sp. M7]